MKIKEKLKFLRHKSFEFLEGFLSYLYGNNCLVCGCSKNVDTLCKNCLKTVENFSPFAHTFFEGVEIYSCAPYCGVVKTLILKLKFNHKKSAAAVLAKIFDSYFSALLLNNPELNRNYVVIPVPTSKSNVRQRGYNNVFEIAKCFSKIRGFNLEKDFLLKIKSTKPQYKLSAKERKDNPIGSFGINQKLNPDKLKKLKGAKFLVIDDIFTTGSTIKEVIKLLKNSEAVSKSKDIICITLSKTT